MRHPVTWTGEGGVLRAQERSKRTNVPRVAKQAGRARGTARAPRIGHRRQKRTTRGVQAAFVGGDATGALVGSADAWQWLGTRLTITAAAFAVYYIFFVPVEVRITLLPRQPPSCRCLYQTQLSMLLLCVTAAGRPKRRQRLPEVRWHRRGGVHVHTLVRWRRWLQSVQLDRLGAVQQLRRWRLEATTDRRPLCPR